MSVIRWTTQNPADWSEFEPKSGGSHPPESFSWRIALRIDLRWWLTQGYLQFFFESVFSLFEGVRSKYMTFWYKIWIEKNCSSSGILERYLSTGKGFFWVFSEMLVSLRCWKKQSRLGFEIFKCGRQGYFFIESRRTASQDIWLEGKKHSPKNLTFHTKCTTLAANPRQK